MDNTQPEWNAALASIEAEATGDMDVIGDLSRIVRRVPVHYAGLIACAIRCRLRGLDMPSEAGGMAVDQPQQNGAYGAHQFRIRLPGDHGNAYRVIIAPADAPISIGGVPANEHFAEPITGGE